MPPAARIGDLHTCPMVNPGPVPHVGGPIIVGCPTVLIGGMPAARVGDACVCVGPPDSIAKGSPSVLIQHMPAARLGDSTVHGGVIVIGFPTVLIGESGGGAGGAALAPPSLLDRFQVWLWNPSHHVTDPADPVGGTPGSTVILGHELVHANHNATGTNGNGPRDTYPGQAGSSARGEERATVGAAGTTITAPDGSVQAVPDHSHDHPTENSLRDDLGLPRRPTYYPSNWPGGGTLVTHPELTLEAEFHLAEAVLTLVYQVQNNAARDVYLLNRLYRTAPAVSLRPEIIYVDLAPATKTVHLAKKLADLPSDRQVSAPVAPFVHPLRHGARFSETVSLPLPLESYQQYQGRPSAVRSATYEAIDFTLGYHWREEGTTEERQTLDGQTLVLPRFAPGRRPTFGTLRSALVHLRIPVLEPVGQGTTNG